MTGEELIKLIRDNDLEDFEVEFSFIDGFDDFPNVRKFDNLSLTDIGFSEKVFILTGEEK